MDTLWQDVRYALRILARSPGFTAIAVLTLALGIGANTAIFSLVNAVILKPLPFRDPSQLLTVWDTYLPQFDKVGISPPELETWQQQRDLFQQTAWYRYVPLDLNLTASDSEPIVAHAAFASAQLFPLLGIGPSRGRAFSGAEDPHSVLLSNRLWHSRFHADPSIVGKTIHLNDDAFTVIGIMPADFQLPDWADLWLPPGPLLGDQLTNPVRHALGFIARLKPGVTKEQARARLEELSRRLAAQHPKTSTGWGIKVAGLQDDLTANIRPALLMLLGAVSLVLLIACANVANLLLSRATGRAKEIAVRAAVGAGTWRLTRQLLTESIVLALLGGVIGLFLANWSLAIVVPARHAIDSRVLLFLAAISILTGVVFGLAPAFQVLRTEPGTVIKSGSATPGGATTLRGALVVLEFALTLVLVIAAGILAKSFLRLMHVDPGFNPNGVLALRIYVPPSRKPDVLLHRLQQRILPFPTVQSLAFSNALPLIAERANTTRFNVPGSPLINPDALPAAQIRIVSADYFRSLQIPIRSGRFFTERDLNQPVVIINQTLARRFWPGKDPVGIKFVTGPWGPKPSWSTIVGVVGNVKDFGLDSEPSMDLYFPGLAPNYLIVKTAANPLAIANATRREIHAIDPEIAIADISTMDQIAAASARTRRWVMGLLAAFAGLALILALVGIYGVMSWSVAQRTREIGIRMALGAHTSQVLKMIVRYGMKLSAMGTALGLLAAVALRPLLSTLVFDISTIDPFIFICVPALMFAVAIAACYFPARRASRVDPLIALRWE